MARNGSFHAVRHEVDGILRNNRSLRRETEDLEERNDAVDSEIRKIEEDEERALRVLLKSREHAADMNEKIRKNISGASGSLVTAVHCADDIRRDAARVGEAFKERNKSIAALRKARRLMIEADADREGRIALRNAAMAGFLNPRLRLVPQSRIRRAVEKLCLSHSDDWVPYAVLALYSRQGGGNKGRAYRGLLVRKPGDALVENEELKRAFSIDSLSTCLFMAVFALEAAVLESGQGKGNADGRIDGSSSLSLSAGEWMLMLGNAIMARFKYKAGGSGAAGAGSVAEEANSAASASGRVSAGTVRFTGNDVWMAEAFLTVYAVSARRLAGARFSQAESLQQRAQQLIQFCIEREGLDRATAAAMLQREHIKQTVSDGNGSEEPQAGRGAGQVPVWEKNSFNADPEEPQDGSRAGQVPVGEKKSFNAEPEEEQTERETRQVPVWEEKDFYTEMAAHCPAYDELAEVMGYAAGCRRIYEEYMSEADISAEEMLELLRGILRELLRRPTEKEAAQEREIRLLELTAEYGGWEEEAGEALFQELRREGEFHLVRGFAKKLQGRPGVRRCLVELLLQKERSALRAYVRDCRARYHEDWPVEIHSFRGKIDFGRGLDTAMEEAEAFIREEEAYQKYKRPVGIPTGLCMAAAILCAVLFLWKSMPASALVSCAVLLASAALFALQGCRRREKLLTRMQDECDSVHYTLRLLFSEFDDIRALYQEYDRYGDYLMEL